jgi:hypothetical protein
MLFETSEGFLQIIILNVFQDIVDNDISGNVILNLVDSSIQALRRLMAKGNLPKSFEVTSECSY